MSATSRDLAKTHGIPVSKAVRAVQEQPQIADFVADTTQESLQALPKNKLLTKSGQPRKNAAKAKPKKGLKGLHPEFAKVAYYSANAIPHGTEYQYVDASGQVLQLAWKDQGKLLLMLSTVHTSKEDWVLASKKTKYTGKDRHHVFEVPKYLTPVYVIGYR
ncbi:hypothetical protein EG328_004742 [Venturia inaequalis]|uniref:Uncharacterized protein n=1 Tax=Venturia inaequalis TaxID=5025 RepID=A0A8H3YWX8_VENIN|nr:hypothetical protein EG328_004742 [Venturia inaequalis]